MYYAVRVSLNQWGFRSGLVFKSRLRVSHTDINGVQLF